MNSKLFTYSITLSLKQLSIRYYYQYNITRLPACTSCVHALLHLPMDIRRTGPVWINWSFVMERYCGTIVRAVKSRSKPYTALSRRLLHQAQIAQIKLQFGLEEELDFSDRVEEVSTKEHVYAECEY